MLDDWRGVSFHIDCYLLAVEGVEFSNERMTRGDSPEKRDRAGDVW